MTGFITKKLSSIVTLGEKLQTHRECKNLTQEKAARLLNMNVRYIKDLEKDNYQELPADIYTINILRRYAELLNLNPHTVIELFRKEKNIYINTQKKKEPKKITWLGKIFNTFLNPRALKYLTVIIVLAAIFFYIGRSINNIISPPELNIESPADNIIITEHQIQISGTTEHEVNLSINNRPLLSDENGKFSLKIDLQTGLNVIKITAKKKHSKEQTVYRKIIVNEPIPTGN
jgi:cytoskeletal protein RodZ